MSGTAPAIVWLTSKRIMLGFIHCIYGRSMFDHHQPSRTCASSHWAVAWLSSMTFNGRHCMRLIKSKVHHKWKSKSNGQEQFACDGMIDLCRIILKHSSYQQQHTFVHVASNTIQYHRVTDPNDHSSSPSLSHCSKRHDRPLTPTHLISCRGSTALDFSRHWGRELCFPIVYGIALSSEPCNQSAKGRMLCQETELCSKIKI